MSKRYNVTLNFTFEYSDPDECDWGYDEESDEENDGDYINAFVSGSEPEKPKAEKPKAEVVTTPPKPKTEGQRRREAFRRTDEYFKTHSLEEHIKENDAFSFVEYVCCDAEVLSAEWDKEKFQIHMVVETELSKEELIHDLEMNSLEDGEYEACGDTGWIVMTRGPDGEQFGSPWDTTNFWVYGLTDYRSNPIEVKKVKMPKEPAAPAATLGGKAEGVLA